MPDVICVDGTEAPERLANFVKELEHWVQLGSAYRQWKANKIAWWSFAKLNPKIIEAYQDVVDAAVLQRRLPLPPSTAYDLVRTAGHKFTRDYSPFFARLMNKQYTCKVFKIKQQAGEPDSVFESLVNPQNSRSEDRST